jgi:hypothetical protein
MRRWGVLVTTFYAVVLVALLIPSATVLGGQSWPADLPAYFKINELWLWVGLLVFGQAMLFVRVDRSWRKLRPRTHVAVTASAMAAAAALLLIALVTSLLAGISGDKGRGGTFNDLLLSKFVALALASWGIWTIVFAVYYRRAPQRMAQVVHWLVAGSILELLVAVPAHIIVRRRNDCSAPGVTAFGIVTGTAVMLMCFGPSVVALYQERRQRYRAAMPAARAHL